MYVTLNTPKRNHESDPRVKQENYHQSAPFFFNKRALLIHRPKAIYQLTVDWADIPWNIVEYWCGNYGRSYDLDSDLLFDPGARLVCARCEAFATIKNQPSSSKLAGRHVCIGNLKPVNICHPNKNQ